MSTEGIGKDIVYVEGIWRAHRARVMSTSRLRRFARPPRLLCRSDKVGIISMPHLRDAEMRAEFYASAQGADDANAFVQ